MSVKEVITGLQEIQEQLKLLDSHYDYTFDDIKQREKINERLNPKVEELHNIQKNLLTFNVSGNLIKINKHLVINTGYATVLSELFYKVESEKKNVNELQNMLIDRDYNNFLIILDILRKKYYEKVLQFNDTYIIFTIPKKTDIKIFREDLDYFFNSNTEKVFDDFKFSYYDVNGDKQIMFGKTNNITNLITGIKCTSWYPNELHTPYKATGIDDIKSITSNKAYFLNYQAYLVIELADIVPVKSIELQPFTTDEDVWFCMDGAGDKISYSTDNVNWEDLTQIPFDYGSGTSVITFPEVNLKYIRIQAGENGCSVSYLKLS